MIAIGRTINNFYLGKEDNNSANEYICWTKEERDEIIKEIGLTEEDKKSSNYSSAFYIKNNIKYTIHSVHKLAIFVSIKKYLFLQENRRIVAPPLLNYTWNRVRASFRNDDINDWENNIVTASFLYNKYLNNNSEKLKFRVKAWASQLAYFGAMANGAHFKEHNFKEYEDFTEGSLFHLFKYNGYFSLYEKCLIKSVTGKQVLSLPVFENLTNEQQLAVVMERLYVDISNEYLLEELIYGTPTEKDTISLFKMVIMNRCSQTSLTWFREYLINNYNKIMTEFDPMFVEQLYDAIKYNHLDPVKYK